MSHSIQKWFSVGDSENEWLSSDVRSIFVFFQFQITIFFQFLTIFSIFQRFFNIRTFYWAEESVCLLETITTVQYLKKVSKLWDLNPEPSAASNYLLNCFQNFELKHIAFNHFSKICVPKKHFSVTSLTLHEPKWPFRDSTSRRDRHSKYHWLTHAHGRHLVAILGTHFSQYSPLLAEQIYHVIFSSNLPTVEYQNSSRDIVCLLCDHEKLNELSLKYFAILEICLGKSQGRVRGCKGC